MSFHDDNACRELIFVKMGKLFSSSYSIVFRLDRFISTREIIHFVSPSPIITFPRVSFCLVGKCITNLIWFGGFSLSLVVVVSDVVLLNPSAEKMFSSNIVEAEGFQPLRRVRACCVLFVSFVMLLNSP